MDLSAKLFVLKENFYLASLPPSEVRELVARLRERHYRANAVIFRKDERCEGLFIVLSGRVRTSITSLEGREQVLRVFGPGRTFADIPVFDDEPLPADAVAVTDSTVVIESQSDVRDLLRRHPEVDLDVIRLLRPAFAPISSSSKTSRFATLSAAWPGCFAITRVEKPRSSKTQPV
jgi:CRP-like cAMP-binding protein